MSLQVPIVRRISWPGIIPQLVALVVCILFSVAILGASSNAVAMGAFCYLAYSFGSRAILLREHHAGIRAAQAGRHEAAIRHFQSSYDFLQRRSWIDRYRFVVLMNPSACTFREMALVNMAVAHVQLGRGAEATVLYERALHEFPGSVLAASGLKIIRTAEK